MKPISVAQVRELKDAGVIKDFAELEASDYFIEYEGTAGAANASAPQVKEDLVAAATLLFLNGRTKSAEGKVLKTQRGRPKSILGSKDGVGDFAISISVAPGKVPKPEDK